MGRKLLNPRMADLLDEIRGADRPSLHSMPVPEARQACQSASEVLELPRAAQAVIGAALQRAFRT